MVKLIARAARGAAAGVVATFAMSGVMLAGQRLGVVGKLEPKHITQTGLDRLGVTRGKGTDESLTVGAHFGYGASLGAVFGIVAPLVPLPRRLRGPAFALGALLASYEGWVPIAGILPDLHEMPPNRRAQLTLSHLVYGAVLGKLA